MRNTSVAQSEYQNRCRKSQLRELGYTEEAINFILDLTITPTFTPIWDLSNSIQLGHEVSYQPEHGILTQEEMFTKASELDTSWEVTRSCLNATFDILKDSPACEHEMKLFLNISSSSLTHPKLLKLWTRPELTELRISPENIVLVLSREPHNNEDLHVSKVLLLLIQQGFSICSKNIPLSLFNFTSMQTTFPKYVKIDSSALKTIGTNESTISFINGLNTFCESMNSSLIVDGISSEMVLKELMKLGIKLMKGSIFSKCPSTTFPSEQLLAPKIKTLIEERNSIGIPMLAINDLVREPLTVDWNETTGRDVHAIFSSTNNTHIILVEKGRDHFGLITKENFMAKASGAYGFALIQNRSSDSLSKNNPLCVKETTSIVELAKTAAMRCTADVYDPVIVIDENKKLVGTIEMRSLILRASQLEVEQARDCNPLTGLAGNRKISFWLKEVATLSTFTIVYFDLDKFKEYNDVYGFAKGDEKISLTAEILRDHCGKDNQSTHLGHIGGDDFIMISVSTLSDSFLEKLLDDFDTQKKQLFDDEHILRGGYFSKNRQGDRIFSPLSTLSAAVVSSENFDFKPHPEHIAFSAAGVKKLAKKKSARYQQSSFVREKRCYKDKNELK